VAARGKWFNVESSQELDRLAQRATLLGRVAPISVRVNPNVDARTHPYISTGLKTNKFGVPVSEAEALYQRANADPALEVIGVDCHIGSQIASAEPLLEALDSLLQLVDRLEAQGVILRHVDLGGGFGVRYRDEPDFDLQTYAAALKAKLSGRDLQLLLEPGRYLVANGGVQLTRVEYLKPAADDGRSFAIVDAAMNDLIRPALYQAWHAVEPVSPAAENARRDHWDIVGPICESGDFLAHDRDLALAPGDLLAVFSAGAYGMAQSSNYNSRPRPAEIMVENDSFRLIRRRENCRELLALEKNLDG
jgi:diaminopimelate decarboxylase